MINFFSQLPKAQKEILNTWEWYENQQPGLGDHFKQEIYNKINLIVKNPLHYPLKGKYREAYIEVFPFLVYKVMKNEVIILSVFHTSRHPKNKR